ncbi:tap domain-containing protein [Neofusicoccum parvum]|nr:tap domain-containing protein [Neofusicoccum parvum]
MNLTGGQFDLVAFNPRGTGNTIPFSCVGGKSSWEEWKRLNPMNAGNATDTALGETWAFSKNYVDTCKSNPNATSIGDKIGTTYVARDLLSVVDALGEDGLLRYWGTSYGTTLGATAAAMFPERIDRLLIDSVMNIHDYWHYHDIENQKDTDKTFTAFLEACFKAGKKCALAQSGKTASSFEDEFYSWLEELKYHPISYPEFLLTYTAVKGYVVSTIYTPARYSSLAEDIKALMKGDLESLSVHGLGQLVPGVLSWSTESSRQRMDGD